MPFCLLSDNSIETSCTVVDNLFISQFMPDAPPRYTEVYLYGLMLSSLPETRNSLDTLCNALGLTALDVKTAFDYWEELGLVTVTGGSDFRVIYQPPKSNSGLLKKIKPGKYRDFNKQIQNILSGRMIEPSEYNEYYMFLETAAFDPEALCAVAEYSVGIKGKDISGRYVLAVARNLAQSGIRALAAVRETLKSRSLHSDDIRLILKSLGSVRKPDPADQQLYEKWTGDMGFTLDAVLYVAKTVRFGGTAGLDRLLEEYYRQKLLSKAEIEAYSQNKSALTETAKQINAALGVYYQNVSAVVEEYVSPWLSKGYDQQTLLLIANYCFKNSVRTLEGMNHTLERFYRLGLVSLESIHQYISQILSGDEKIKQILSEMGLMRRVTKTDRANYKIWTSEWHMDDALILSAAQKSRGKDNPSAYMSKLLADYKASGIKTAAQAATDAKSAAAVSYGYRQRNYSPEELKALFDNLDDIEV